MPNRLQHFLTHLLGSKSSPVSAVATQEPPPWQQFQSLLGKIEEVADSAVHGERNPRQDAQQAAAIQDEESKAKLWHRAMLLDILDMHDRLSTGMKEADLERAAAWLKAHTVEFHSHRNEHLPDLALFSILHRFHLEARLRGWDELLRRASEHGVSWPEPFGVSPHADAGERERARAQQLASERQHFLDTKMFVFADLMLGVVPVWRATYPEPQGSLWQSTVLLGVGAALASCHNQRIVELAEHHHQEWETLLNDRLAADLRDIQLQLASGVDSIATARKLTDQAGKICQEVVPELVWSQVAPELEPEAPGRMR